MFCAKCDCEYAGWKKKKCPYCSTLLIDRVSEEEQPVAESPAYAALVDKVKANGGSLTVKLFTTDVGSCREASFPGLGWSFAWPRFIGGEDNGVQAKLTTREVRFERKIYFPIIGFSYSWAQRIRATIDGVTFTLVATKVEKQNKWFLPLRMGWGFAWVQEMEANIGRRLHASYVTTNVGRQTQSLPTYGWGYAWSDRADLTLRIVD